MCCTCQNFHLFACTLMNVNVFLQCCDHIAFNDYTLHLLCHYAGFEGLNKFKKVRGEVLPDFLKVHENYNWFKEVMANILSKKGMSHEEYLVKLLKGAIPFDEGAILLFARTTGLHFGVIMNDEYWCTNCDNDPEKWAGMFMYAGNLKFLKILRRHYCWTDGDGRLLRVIKPQCLRIASWLYSTTQSLCK